MTKRVMAMTVAVLGVAAAAVMAEVAPPGSLPCFPGAYYRKAVSSVDGWTGIEGVVTLPTITFDESRKRPGKPEQYLDNPSVYIGGRAGEQEIDAGVTWEVIREPDGTTSKGRKAFRPFWRNKGWHAGPAHPDFYFYPGDTLRMRIESREENKLTLSIELVERGEVGKKNTERFGPATRPSRGLTVEFDAFGFGPERLQQFKRVNAIDQVGREGKDVEPTRTSVGGAVWREVYLKRRDEKVPMVAARFTDMRCPKADHFVVKGLDRGGETIEIAGRP